MHAVCVRSYIFAYMCRVLCVSVGCEWGWLGEELWLLPLTGLAVWRVTMISLSASFSRGIRWGREALIDRIRWEVSPTAEASASDARPLKTDRWWWLSWSEKQENGNVIGLAVCQHTHVLLSPLIAELSKCPSSCWFAKMFSCKRFAG